MALSAGQMADCIRDVVEADLVVWQSLLYSAPEGQVGAVLVLQLDDGSVYRVHVMKVAPGNSINGITAES